MVEQIAERFQHFSVVDVVEVIQHQGHHSGQIRQAGQVDPVAFRAVWRLMGMIGHPSDAYDDADLAARVRAALAAGVPAAVRQPTRAQLEAALAA